jgi:hypothetical protein
MEGGHMDSLWWFLFLVSVSASLLSFTLIARWYVVPRLNSVPRATALLPLLLVNTFRTVGLTFLVPQVTGAPLPLGFAAPAAAGNVLAMILAFVSVFALRLRWPFALVLVWVFNIEGSVDLLFAYIQGVRYGFPTLQVGPVWYIPTFVVPLLLVIHVLIFWLLLRPSPQEQRRAEKPI